ncbi:cytidylyltransferase domain-containing protein [Pseudomonas alloputida]|uniref:acylneuraminate cytidylyltransferase family protein n=1 Tax=Pseudomonas TaxID=286 RepID=UPI003EEBFFFF
MNKQKLTCFLPCRKGSERIPQKNIKPFAGFKFGLIEIKLKQLIESSSIDEIMLSTNDDCILEYASSLKCDKIKLHKRSDALSSSSTSTDELVAHAASLIQEGNILWTHVTSPFLTADRYNEIISLYYKKINEGYDSLMTTTLIHSFLWNQQQPLNYDRNVEKWPRTQTLEAIHEINSGAFIASTEIYSTLDDRIGQKPYLYPLDKLVSHDIDWPEDFTVAECLIEKGLAKV